jgi:2-phospho-L-lactate guanylyltransferase
MNVWAIVPVKPLAEAKSRLSEVLTAEERQWLSRHMLDKVLAVLLDHPALAGTVVVSRDPAALHGLPGRGLTGLAETGRDLNAALRQATNWICERQGDAVLVLPADVPLVEPEDVTTMVGLAQEDRCAVIAPCRREEGTNALLVRPAGAIDYTFGPGSFARHCRQAEAHGLAVHVYRSASLALDIDQPADLTEYANTLPPTFPLPPFFWLNGGRAMGASIPFRVFDEVSPKVYNPRPEVYDGKDDVQ